jgi:hypothetical protein
MIRRQQQVGTEQLVGLTVKRLANTRSAKKPTAVSAATATDQRRRQQPQLTATRIATQHSPGEGP